MLSHVQSMLHVIKYQKQDLWNTDYVLDISQALYDKGSLVSYQLPLHWG